MAKYYNHEGKVLDLKQLMDFIVFIDIVEVKKYKYNRVKYNNMDYSEQAEYEKKLKETKKAYRIYTEKTEGKETFYDITKKEYLTIEKSFNLDSLFKNDKTEIKYTIKEGV